MNKEQSKTCAAKPFPLLKSIKTVGSIYHLISIWYDVSSQRISGLEEQERK